ncbi:hypothetical protein D3C79_799970 [compost metagenome]
MEMIKAAYDNCHVIMYLITLIPDYLIQQLIGHILRIVALKLLNQSFHPYLFINGISGRIINTIGHHNENIARAQLHADQIDFNIFNNPDGQIA